MSKYRISELIGLDKSVMSRFMAGKSGLSVETLDRLGEVLKLRVVAGILIGAPTGNLLLGDGVNFNIGAQGGNVTANGISTVFPYLPTPHDGRNRRHIDCGEPGANPCGPLVP